MARTIIKKSITVFVLTAIAFGAMLLFGGKKAGGAAVKVDARVAINAAIDDDLTVHFSETYSINSDKVKNGNGRRWVFVPPGNTYQFEGIEDVTTGEPTKVVTASSTATGEKNEIHWMYPPKTGRRTFVVKYTIKGAARPASGGGYVFSWTFFDKSNPLNVDDFSVAVAAPSGGTVESPAFFRAGGKFESLQGGGNSIEVKYGKLNAFTIVEATFPFAGDVVPATGIQAVPGTAKSASESIRNQWETKARNDRFTALIMKVLPVALAVVIIVIVWLLFHFLGREYKIDNPPIYERELPTGETPAEVGWLTRFGAIDTTDLTGTIIDLARRRHMKIQEPLDREEENVILVATPDKAKSGEVLAPHEMRTLLWLFPAGVTTVDFNARKEELKKTQTTWTEFWSGFQSDVDNIGNSKGLIERKSSGCLVVGLSIFGILLIVLSVVAGINWSRWWVALAFAGAVSTVTSGGMSKRSRLGAETNEKWQAFKRYIHDFSTIPDHPPASVVVWEHYLAYAIPLGEGDTVVEYMKLRPPVEGERDWYPANTAALLWMSSGVSGWESAGTPSSSSGGGGFSGGGGGGFGGGGGASFD